MSKQGEIIEVCGKKVMVRYTRDGQPCEKCVFGEKDSLCQRVRDECSRLDKVGMEIDERAYFVEAGQQEEKDYKRLYEELVNSEWYKKYYQGASVGDSVAVEQPKADLDAESERFLDDVEGVPRMYHCDEQIEWGKDIARHFAELGRERLMKEAHDGTIERDCGGQVMLDVPDIWEHGEYTLLNPRKYSDMKPKERRRVKVLIVENE